MRQRDVMDDTHSSNKESNEVLRQQGYRSTPQRYIILKVLQEAQEHLSIEQILERVQHFYPNVNLSTVYRTLDLLKELRLVRETYFPADKHLKYEMFTERIHHHLTCRTCGTIMHLDEVVQEELYDLLQRHHHFHHLTLDMMSVGYCDACWTRLSEQERAAQSER